MTGLSRRGLITGLIALAAAPAIVRASSLMPVKVMEPIDLYVLLRHRMDEAYRLTRDNMARSLYGDGMATTIWYMDENIEPIAFNKFFARVEFPNGR